MSNTKYKISVACVLIHNDKILLIREKQAGRIALDVPAGGVEANETLDDACIREVNEETGLRIDNLESIGYVLGTVNDVVTISFVYKSILYNKPKLILPNLDEDNILSFKWASINELKQLLTISSNWEHSVAVKRLELFLNTLSA